MSESNKPSPSSTAAPEPRIDALPPASEADPREGPRAQLAKAIPRRPRVTWTIGLAIAIAFASIVIPVVTADRWLVATVVERGVPAPATVRVPPFSGYQLDGAHVGHGGVLIARGEIPDRDTAELAAAIERAQPRGAAPYLAYLLLFGVVGALFAHHTRRSTRGRLLRVQLVSFGLIAIAAIAIKAAMMTTALGVLVVPVAVFSMVPTLVLDRVVGLATGTLAALVVSFLVPFDVGVAILLLVQAGAAGLVIAERPKKPLRAVVTAGATATLFTAATYPLMLYLTAGRLPLEELADPWHSGWIAAATGPALATVLAVILVPLYQLLVGEITHRKLVELEDLSHPLLAQIADKAPGTWQHSLTMANMAEIAANAIGANGRLVRVGAYFHDLGKSLQPKYFIENLEPGETSPHDKLPPEVSCDAIFAHVTEGIVAARKAGLHERIVDFMHMHHGNGVLEYFWAKCREQGNPRGLTVEHFRYPGVPPQSRETAILSICDAVEAAARTLKKPEVSAIDNLVQRIVYGKLHLGQLDQSGLSMGDLRRVAESLRETIRHANHGRIEYPWQKAQQDASAGPDQDKLTATGPRLDSLDRPARPEAVAARATSASPSESDGALAATDAAGATPRLRGPVRDSSELATKTTAPVAALDPATGPRDAAVAGAWRADAQPSGEHLPPSDAAMAFDPGRLAELAAASMEMPVAPDESDPRMRRVTNPVGDRPPSAEAIQFAVEARDALEEASRDLAAQPRELEGDEPERARKRAATLPPLRPPTIPPPLGRRPPTLPPMMPLRPPTQPPPDVLRPPTMPPPYVTAPPPDVLRPPASPSQTVPPPGVVRPPAANVLDDMITLRPRYEPRPELAVSERDDGSVVIEPAPPAAPSASEDSDDSTSTQPRLVVAADDTAPNLPLARDPKTSWARGLAARLDRQLEEDFGTDTPVSAPTRAELQALMGQAPDPTRQQSIEELERLHEASRERPSEEELLRPPRRPHPTAEIDEADIEAAIELAPPARARNAIGVAKKKPTE